MEESGLDIIAYPAKIVVTKQSLSLIQTEKGKHQFESYRLNGDVIGFELARIPSSPSASSPAGGSLFVSLTLIGIFGVLTYGARAGSWFSVDVVLPALIAIFALIAIEVSLLTPKVQPGLDYGLKIQLAAAPDKLLPCASRKEVQTAVSEIYSFIHSGAYLSRIIVRNQLFRMETEVQRHTPAD